MAVGVWHHCIYVEDIIISAIRMLMLSDGVVCVYGADWLESLA